MENTMEPEKTTLTATDVGEMSKAMPEEAAQEDPTTKAERDRKEAIERDKKLAKEAHDKRVDEHKKKLDALDPKVKELGDLLDQSASKMETDPGHAGYAESFVRQVHLSIDEWIAWIKRHV